MPHPAHTPELGFESVEDLDPSTVDRLAIVGPHIYTDGSKTEGKVGAALTEWRDEMESGNSTFRLESFCTVFQAEMFALHRAIKRVKEGKDRLVNIFSDSKSSLQMLTAPKTYNPLAHAARQDIRDIVAEGREVRLFWVRAHAGTTGNERADELARNAALKKKTAADYDRYPLSYAKKVIRAASLDEWQQRYTEGGTGEITKCFFPRVEGAYRVLSRFTITPPIAQTLTGHGGFAQYLNRFKLKDSPYCACAPDKVQDVLHVLEECPIFGRERAETEAGTGVVVARHGFPALLTTKQKKNIFEFCERVTRSKGNHHYTLTKLLNKYLNKNKKNKKCRQRVKAAPKKLQHLTSKGTKPRLRTLQSRMVKRPLRVQTDLSEAGSVKRSQPAKQYAGRTQTVRNTKVQEWEQAMPLVTTRNRRRFDSPHHLSPLKVK
ncbi:Retrovirus-related Pol polyprotein from type-1 retrotransposable element R1 3 [Eumeta japonica]|uniref:ribonuclease H n=1 Tax=Eumeta variegata TaxID=151549 RepID=A0A4C2AF65_EUMVA|nr:Retrovirus-related Pol polyprotein from type-1 retrotransposable element R1 3 [Eumeta japonica]